MKRFKPDIHIDNNPHSVSKHKSFLKWYDCEGCGLQFRRENGWTWRELGDWGYFTFKYACSECANSIKGCNELIDQIAEKKRIARQTVLSKYNESNKPPAPPPPPMRGYDGRAFFNYPPMPKVKPLRKEDDEQAQV